MDDLLVGADRVQGVGAGQVLDRQSGVADLAGSQGALDGDARVVTGLGVQTGQGVVDGGLTGIGGTRQGDTSGPGHQRLGAVRTAVAVSALIGVRIVGRLPGGLLRSVAGAHGISPVVCSVSVAACRPAGLG